MTSRKIHFEKRHFTGSMAARGQPPESEHPHGAEHLHAAAARRDTEPGGEEELEAFMRSHEEILEGADSVRELRRVGGELVDAFRNDAPRLAEELLVFCRAVVAASSVTAFALVAEKPALAERARAAPRAIVPLAHDMGLLDAVIEQARARAARARLALRLAKQAHARSQLLGSPRDTEPAVVSPTRLAASTTMPATPSGWYLNGIHAHGDDDHGGVMIGGDGAGPDDKELRAATPSAASLASTATLTQFSAAYTHGPTDCDAGSTPATKPPPTPPVFFQDLVGGPQPTRSPVQMPAATSAWPAPVCAGEAAGEDVQCQWSLKWRPPSSWRWQRGAHTDIDAPCPGRGRAGRRWGAGQGRVLVFVVVLMFGVVGVAWWRKYARMRRQLGALARLVERQRADLRVLQHAIELRL